MSAAAALILATIVCAISSVAVLFIAAYRGTQGAGAGTGAGAGAIGSATDALNSAVANAAVGPAPDPKSWKFVSAMITGKILDTLDAKTVTLDQAKAKCHAQATCTHVDFWKDRGKYYLKDATGLPQECIDVTKRCSDGDWKDSSGSGGYFHPARGWGPKADSVETGLKQSECSSGSSCAKTKIMNILSMATIPFDVLGGVAGFGAGTSSTFLTTFGRVATIADYASDISTGAQMLSTVKDATTKDKSTGDYPYSNRPFISTTNYTIGTGKGPSYRNFVRSKHGCSGTGSANFRTSCNEWQWTPADTACVSKVKASDFPAWQKAYDAWKALPESDGNYNSVDWEALYNSDSSPLMTCEDANKGTLSPLVRVQDGADATANAQSGRLRASSSRASNPAAKRATTRPATVARGTTKPAVRRSIPTPPAKK